MTSQASSSAATTAAPAPAPADEAVPPAGSGRPWVGRALVAAVLAVLVMLGLRAELGLLTLLTTALMYVMIAQGWNVLGGYGGYLNLGMAAFFGIGAYTTAILFVRFGWSPFATLPLAGLASALLAMVVGLPSLRLRGSYFAILTLVIGFLIQTYALNSSLTQGAMGLFLDAPTSGPRRTEQVFFFVYLVLAVAVTVVVLFVERSKFGYALRAIREDEDAAEILGVQTTRVKMRALLLGAVIAGVAGGLYSYRIGYIEPGGIFALTLSIDVVLMTTVGGAGSWIGPVLGAPLIVVLADVLRVTVTRLQVFGASVPTEFNRVVLGLLLVGVALYAKRGIVGLFQRARGRRFLV
jgi:branched-chain amino acid transport system permease protein